MYKLILFDFSDDDGGYEPSARIVGALTDPELISVALERIRTRRERDLNRLPKITMLPGGMEACKGSLDE